MDVLILNTAVMDLRGPSFEFASQLAGAGGLARCETAELPPYTQSQIAEWIAAGGASAGGPGNTAPLLQRAGIQTAVGVYLGAGAFGGFDIQGRTFFDILATSGVDMSAVLSHPTLPTGTTFIHEVPHHERGGIAYFPNANNDFNFDAFLPHVERLGPRILYYMYSGLSERGDADGGRDLARFMRRCREMGCLTIADSHTLCGTPQAFIESGDPVEAYRLLEPLLPELDIFFTSSDEAKMMVNTLDRARAWNDYTAEENLSYYLSFVRERYIEQGSRARLFGVTVKDGAMAGYYPAGKGIPESGMYTSRFMDCGVVDLVGAGDSFRAGVIAYVARNTEAFRAGGFKLSEAIQMGNLMASLYVQAPLNDRYRGILAYEDLLERVR